MIALTTLLVIPFQIQALAFIFRSRAIVYSLSPVSTVRSSRLYAGRQKKSAKTPSAKSSNVESTISSHCWRSVCDEHETTECRSLNCIEDCRYHDPKKSTAMSTSRRSFMSDTGTFLSMPLLSATAMLCNVEPSNAGEVGAQITKAVTTSDLGLSVRRSVVKGAQFIDNLDGKWEKFSDENNLGKERAKREARPKPKDIPDPLPLDVIVARAVLRASDDAFLSMVPPEIDLKAQIVKVDKLVRTTFERGGLTLLSSSTGEEGDALDAKQFNYYCYVHFKAYCMLLVEKKIPFNRKNFESALGERLLSIFLPQEIVSVAATKNGNKEDALRDAIQNGFTLTDRICNSLKSYGFVSLTERSDLESESIADWAKDQSDLQFSVPIDGDVTLNSQILLQEQGYRIYPSFGRVAVTAALQRSLIGLNQIVSSEDYYLDTNWNSDPDLFEVRQVLVNIVIDSA